MTNPKAVAPPEEPKTVAPKEAKKPILIIEDNPVQQLTYKGLFGGHKELQPFQPIMAKTGREALGLLVTLNGAANDPGVILLDLELPDMNGLQLLLAIRKDPRWIKIPVIVISGSSEKNESLRVKAAGAQEYISKPIRNDKLVEKILRYVVSVKA